MKILDPIQPPNAMKPRGLDPAQGGPPSLTLPLEGGGGGGGDFPRATGGRAIGIFLAVVALFTASCAGFRIRDVKTDTLYFSVHPPSNSEEDEAVFRDCRTGVIITLPLYAVRRISKKEWDEALRESSYCRTFEGNRQGCFCEDAR